MIIYILFFIGLLYTIIHLYFYREEPLYIRSNSDTLFSPSYGTIKSIVYKDNTIFIAIFLSPLDIHYQYIPIDGTLIKTDYDKTGNYALAYELNKSNDNEKAIHYLQTKHGTVVIYQICGFLTRRIQYYIKPEQQVKTGERLGIIKLGSRVDIIIPNANNFLMNVSLNQKLYGSSSKIGEWIR